MLWWSAPRIDALNSGDDDLEMEMEQANKPVVGGDFVGEKVSETDADQTPGVGRRNEWSSWRLGGRFSLFFSGVGWGGVVRCITWRFYGRLFFSVVGGDFAGEKVNEANADQTAGVGG